MKTLILSVVLFVMAFTAKSEVLFFQAYDKDDKFEILLDSIRLICNDGRDTTLTEVQYIHFRWDKISDVKDNFDIKSSNTIKNFPNPFNNITYFKLDFVTDLNIYINVYSIQGKLVHTESQFVRKYQDYLKLDLTLLNEGIYIVSINIGGKVITSKVIKSSHFSNPSTSSSPEDNNNFLSLLNTKINPQILENTKYTFIGFASGYENDTLRLNSFADFTSQIFYMNRNSEMMLADSISFLLNLPGSIMHHHAEVDVGYDYIIRDFNKSIDLVLNKTFYNAKIFDNKFSWTYSFENYDEFYQRHHLTADIDTINKIIKYFEFEYMLDSLDNGWPNRIEIRETIKISNIPYIIEDNKIIATIKKEELKNNLVYYYHFHEHNDKSSEELDYTKAVDYNDDSYFKIIIQLKQ